jgi:hypothetical protein
LCKPSSTELVSSNPNSKLCMEQKRYVAVVDW